MVIYAKTPRPLGGKPLTRMTPQLAWRLIKLFSMLHGALTEEEQDSRRHFSFSFTALCLCSKYTTVRSVSVVCVRILFHLGSMSFICFIFILHRTGGKLNIGFTTRAKFNRILNDGDITPQLMETFHDAALAPLTKAVE